MRPALGVLLATLGGTVIAVGTFGLAATIQTSGPLSFGATAISIAPLAAVGVMLVYGATAIARWSRRGLVFGIVGAASGAPLVLLGLILKFGISDSRSDVAEAVRPFLSAGGVLLVAELCSLHMSAVEGMVHLAEGPTQRRARAGQDRDSRAGLTMAASPAATTEAGTPGDSVVPPIWLDATGRPRLTRACWTCGREVAPMRFRAEHFRPHGWTPPQMLTRS
jgi:hypothetical protein